MYSIPFFQGTTRARVKKTRLFSYNPLFRIKRRALLAPTIDITLNHRLLLSPFVHYRKKYGKSNYPPGSSQTIRGFNS